MLGDGGMDEKERGPLQLHPASRQVALNLRSSSEAGPRGSDCREHSLITAWKSSAHPCAPREDLDALVAFSAGGNGSVDTVEVDGCRPIAVDTSARACLTTNFEGAPELFNCRLMKLAERER